MPKKENAKSADKNTNVAHKTGVKDPASRGSATKRTPFRAKYLVAIIIVVAIIGAAIFAGSFINQNQGGSFNTFKSNFNAAPRVAITVTAYNGTVLSGTVGCATAIIIQIASSQQNHRNISTIDFNEIANQTSCIMVRGFSGNGPNPNFTITSVQNCINITNAEPSIYINYSSSSNTTIIKPRLLYIAGTSTFLRQCGVASEIS